VAVITDYSTLQTAVADYLARSDLTDFIPNFIQNCEGKLYKNLRIRAMETALSGTIASGVLAAPSDFVALKYAYVNTSPVQVLDWVPPEMIYARHPVRSGSAEIPTQISLEASNFIFGPYPGSYAVAGIYYKRLTALSDSNTSNWFITDAPDLLLYGALLEAEPFLKNDARIETWNGFYRLSYDAVDKEQKRQRTAAGSIAARLG
jgi:hypothetical protein